MLVLNSLQDTIRQSGHLLFLGRHKNSIPPAHAQPGQPRLPPPLNGYPAACLQYEKKSIESPVQFLTAKAYNIHTAQMANVSAASLWSASSSVGERSVRSVRSSRSARSARSSACSSARSSMGGAGAGAPGSAASRRTPTHRAKLRANSADGFSGAGTGCGGGGSSSVHSYGSTGTTSTSRSDAMRLRLENALRNAESGESDHPGSSDDWMAEMNMGGGASSIRNSSSDGHCDTTAPLNDAAPAFHYSGYTGSGSSSRRRRARSHEDLERTGTGIGLYSSSLAREENRRRSEAYHDDLQGDLPAQSGASASAASSASSSQRRSRYSTGTFSTDDDDDDDDDNNDEQYGATKITATATKTAHDSSKSFGSEGSRSSVGLHQIAHSLDMEERYGRSAAARGGGGLGTGTGAPYMYAPSAKDILNGKGNAQGMGTGTGTGTGTGGFGFNDDGDRWAAREQRWLHQQRDKREEEMMGVGVHRDVDLHPDDQDGHGEERKQQQQDNDEDRRLDDLRRRSIGGSSGSDRRIRRSSMGQTVSSDAVPRVFAGSLASMGISISRNIAEEIPEPAVKTPTTTGAASRSVGLAQTPASTITNSGSAIPTETTAASDSPASFIPTSAQFNEQTNQLFSRLGSLGRTVGDSVGDAVSTALKNRQEQIKAQNRRAAAAAAASGGKKKSRSGSKGGGRANTGGRQRRKRRNSARNAKNSSRFFTPSVDGRGVLPQTITEADEEEDDTLFSKLAIRGFNLARLVDETVPNAERLAAESSGDEFDDDDLDDDDVEEEKKTQASGERDYTRDGSGFEHPDDPPIPSAIGNDSGPNYGNQSLAASMFPADSYGEDDDRSTHWEVDSQADATTSFASRRSSIPQQQDHQRPRLSDHLNANSPSAGADSADEDHADDKEDDTKSVQSQASSVRSSSSALSSKVAEWKREHRASGARSVDGGGASVSTRSYTRNRRPRAGSSASNPPGEVAAIPIMSQRQRGVAVGTAGASGGANALAIATKNLSRLAEAQQQKKRNAAYTAAAGGGGDSSASTGALDRMKKSTSGDSLGSRDSATRSLKSVGGGNSTWNFANK